MSETSAHSARATRAQRQQETRQSLVDAARVVFARSGYHGAGLDEIAAVAGFSKGAVYSNFSNKADLFLAVMDSNLELAQHELPDPFERVESVLPEERDDRLVCEVEEVGHGVALATLEFIAVAVRDRELAIALRTRVQAMVNVYAGVVAKHARGDDPLSDEEHGALLAAFDQGLSMLWLAGMSNLDQRSLRQGMRRLLDPARSAAAEADAQSGDAATAGESPVMDPAMTRSIVADIKRGESPGVAD